MEETFNSKSIILNREPFRETDSRITVFAKKCGKRKLIARGARKIKSKTSSHIEPISLSELMIVCGKQFDYIGSAVSRIVYPNIKSSPEKITLALRVLNLVNKITREGEVGDFNLQFLIIENFLKTQEKSSKNRGDDMYLIFALKFSRELGFYFDDFRGRQEKTIIDFLYNNDFDKIGIFLDQKTGDFSKILIKIAKFLEYSLEMPFSLIKKEK